MAKRCTQFSKLPIRQLTGLDIATDVTELSKLPIRQLTGNAKVCVTPFISKLPIRQLTESFARISSSCLSSQQVTFI